MTMGDRNESLMDRILHDAERQYRAVLAALADGWDPRPRPVEEIVAELREKYNVEEPVHTSAGNTRPLHVTRVDPPDRAHYVNLYPEPSERQVEVAPGVIIDLGESGQLVGVELLDCPCRDHDASNFNVQRDET